MFGADADDATLTIADGRMTVDVAPGEGGRLAGVRVDGVDLLVRRHRGPESSGPIGWGSYPMVPWAGRVRNGLFVFEGRAHRLPTNLGDHAIHGVGFTSPWTVAFHDERSIELELSLPADERWPFGGSCKQRIAVTNDGLRLELRVTADRRACPVSIGWHPWFRKPRRIEFHPTAMYRRDDAGIAVDELVTVPPGPWDDCFVNDRPIVVVIDEVEVTLTSDCTRWVVFDEKPHATCIEPQTGPPDALNIEPHVLRPGDSLSAWYSLRCRHSR